jgi:hypothetical protein
MADAAPMIDPYDPPHPDGPVDPDDIPGPPLAAVSWLHDEEPPDDEWQSGFRPHLEDPE